MAKLLRRTYDAWMLLILATLAVEIEGFIGSFSLMAEQQNCVDDVQPFACPTANEYMFIADILEVYLQNLGAHYIPDCQERTWNTSDQCTSMGAKQYIQETCPGGKSCDMYVDYGYDLTVYDIYRINYFCCYRPRPTTDTTTELPFTTTEPTTTPPTTTEPTTAPPTTTQSTTTPPTTTEPTTAPPTTTQPTTAPPTTTEPTTAPPTTTEPTTAPSTTTEPTTAPPTTTEPTTAPSTTTSHTTAPPTTTDHTTAPPTTTTSTTAPPTTTEPTTAPPTTTEPTTAPSTTTSHTTAPPTTTDHTTAPPTTTTSTTAPPTTTEPTTAPHTTTQPTTAPPTTTEPTTAPPTTTKPTTAPPTTTELTTAPPTTTVPTTAPPTTTDHTTAPPTTIQEPDNLPCNPSNVHIVGRRTNSSSPLTFPRYLPLSFRGYTGLVQCDLTTFRVSLRWTIFQVGATGIETAVALPESLATYLLEIIFPKGALKYGLHVLRFEAEVISQSGYGYVIGRGSDRVWVRINPSPPKAIIQGGSARSVGYSSSLILDASGSFDPDNSLEPTRDLQYEWYCSKGDGHDQGSHVNPCFGDGYRLPFTDSSVQMQANTLVPGEIYRFVVTVSLSGRGNSSTSQSITVVAQDPPILSISCLQNCDEKLSIGERVVLHVTSLTSSVSYIWDVLTRNNVPDEVFNWDELTTTGRYSSYLVIVGGGFDDGDYRKRSVRVTGFHPESPPGYADYTFELNAPPRIGTCSLEPANGFALQTDFIINCVDFWDEEGHLMYTVRVPPVVGNNHQAALQYLDPVLYSGAASTTPSVYLPLGDKSNGYLVTIAIEVADIHGASVLFTMTAQVQPPETVNLGDDASTSEVLRNLTRGSDSKLHDLVSQGDFQTAFQIIGAVGSILDSHDKVTGGGEGHAESLKNKELRQEIRTSTVDIIADMPVESVVALQQSSYALVAITQDKTEVTQQTQLTAASTLAKMGAFLKKHSFERTDCESCQTSIDDAALNLVTGLSNILDAAVASVDELNKVSEAKNETTPIKEAGDDDDVREEVKEKSKAVTKATLAVISDVHDALMVNKVPGEVPTVIHSPILTLTSQRHEKDTLGQRSIGMTKTEPVGFILPDATAIESILSANYTDAIDTQMVQFSTDPFVWSEGSEDITSEVIGLQLKTVDQKEIKVANLPEDIQIFISRRTSTLANNSEVTVNRNTTVVVSFQVTNLNATISVLALPSVSSEELACCLLYQGNESLGNLSKSDCYINVTLPGETSKYQLPTSDIDRELTQRYTWMIQPQFLRGEGAYHALCSLPVSLATNQGRVPAANPDTLMLLVGVYSSQCLFWNEEEERWDDKGCRVGSLSSPDLTQCLCNHLTSFGSSFLVMPNKIDFLADTRLFLTFLDNPIVVTTVAFILVIYISVAVWARRQDKADAFKACVITLEDNDPYAQYRYNVTVVTGMRRGAGTTATATLTLIGTRGQSRPHVLRDKQRKVLQRGGVDSFLIMTKKSLGDVTNVRVWHDNEGENPEWYASRIAVHDLETDEWWFILCNSWLGVDMDEGLIDRTFPTAPEKELKNFRHLFSTRTIRDIQDGHLWFSIFSRPARSTFTRLQRVSCCLSLLMCVMLTSIMFYGVPRDPAEQTMDFGAFSITFTEILVGIESSILAFPINLLIVTIFRYARPPDEGKSKAYKIITGHPHLSSSETSSSFSLIEEFGLSTDSNKFTSKKRKLREDTSSSEFPLSTEETSRETPSDTTDSLTESTGNRKPESSGKETTSGYSQSTQATNLISTSCISSKSSHNTFLRSCLDQIVDDLDLLSPDCFSSMEQYFLARQEAKNILLTVMTIQTPSSSPTDASETDSQSDKAFSRCSFKFLPNGLPHWFIYIGWSLVFSTTLVSSYFTMLYGLKYGMKRSTDWLVSLVVSLFQSIFFLQPLKVLLLAAFLALVTKQWERDDDGSDDIQERQVENARAIYKKLVHKWKGTHYRPPTTAEVNTSRQRKDMERKMYALLREIVGYFLFIWLVLVLAYSQRDRYAYYLTKNIKDVFFSNDEYDSVTDFSGFFEWADVTLLPGLYEGDATIDTMSFLVGGVRIRQLRVRPDLCNMDNSVTMVTGIIGRCTLSYSQDTEDTAAYNASWSEPLHNLTANGSYPKKQDLWRYQHNVASGLWGQVTSYAGGGYVVNLGLNQTIARQVLVDLMADRWIDERTKALVVEWTVYNANTNLFVVVTFLTEVPVTGSFVKTTQIQANRFFRNVAKFQLFVLCIEILFCMFAAIYAVIEARMLYKEGCSYWKNGWNWLQIAIVIVCIVIIAFYIYRQVFTERLLKIFRTKPRKFIDFRAAATIAETFQYLLGFLLILCTVKFLHLLRLNPRMYLLTSVLSSSANEVGAFAGYIGLVICAFSLLFQLSFGRYLGTYSTIVLTFEFLFVLFLGEYDHNELFAVKGITAYIFVVIFQVVTTVLLLNILISILTTNMKYIRRHQEPSEDGKIGILLIYKILSWFGIKHRYKM